MSERTSRRGSPEHCSGDMYSTVPAKESPMGGVGSSAEERAGALVGRARPKSKKPADPVVSSRKTFSGLRSPWRKPRECTTSSESSRARARAANSASCMGPDTCARRCARVGSAMNRMTR